ncbi:MAG: hypothetical protein V3S01_06915 [Dehalococcoidia bacterium]
MNTVTFNESPKTRPPLLVILSLTWVLLTTATVGYYGKRVVDIESRADYTRDWSDGVHHAMVEELRANDEMIEAYQIETDAVVCGLSFVAAQMDIDHGQPLAIEEVEYFMERCGNSHFRDLVWPGEDTI